jgi:hypothetical protein
VNVSHELAAARAVEQLRAFIHQCEGVDMRPGSRLAKELALARRAVAAYEEVQGWDLDELKGARRNGRTAHEVSSCDNAA